MHSFIYRIDKVAPPHVQFQITSKLWKQLSKINSFADIKMAARNVVLKYRRTFHINICQKINWMGTMFNKTSRDQDRDGWTK